MEIWMGLIWMFMALLLLAQYVPVCKDLKGLDLFMVFVILVAGAPIFIAATALESVLSYFLPEGWNDDDDFTKL